MRQGTPAYICKASHGQVCTEVRVVLRPSVTVARMERSEQALSTRLRILTLGAYVHHQEERKTQCQIVQKRCLPSSLYLLIQMEQNSPPLSPKFIMWSMRMLTCTCW